MRTKNPKPLEGAEAHAFVNGLREYLGLEPLYGSEGSEAVKYYGKRRAQAKQLQDALDAAEPIAAE